jgi:hypothetical protein
MPDSNSITKDIQTLEMGGVYTGDETELARMGYKQELKCVQFSSTTLVFRCLYYILTARRDLTLMQVRWSRNDRARKVFKGTHPTELRCLVFHYQYPHWYSPHVSLRFGEHTLRNELFVF